MRLLTDLPEELLEYLASQLGLPELLSLVSCTRALRELFAANDLFWRQYCEARRWTKPCSAGDGGAIRQRASPQEVISAAEAWTRAQTPFFRSTGTGTWRDFAKAGWLRERGWRKGEFRTVVLARSADRVWRFKIDSSAPAVVWTTQMPGGLYAAPINDGKEHNADAVEAFEAGHHAHVELSEQHMVSVDQQGQPWMLTRQNAGGSMSYLPQPLALPDDDCSATKARFPHYVGFAGRGADRLFLWDLRTPSAAPRSFHLPPQVNNPLVLYVELDDELIFVLDGRSDVLHVFDMVNDCWLESYRPNEKRLNAVHWHDGWLVIMGRHGLEIIPDYKRFLRLSAPERALLPAHQQVAGWSPWWSRQLPFAEVPAFKQLSVENGRILVCVSQDEFTGFPRVGPTPDSAMHAILEIKVSDVERWLRIPSAPTPPVRILVPLLPTFDHMERLESDATGFYVSARSSLVLPADIVAERERQLLAWLASGGWLRAGTGAQNTDNSSYFTTSPFTPTVAQLFDHRTPEERPYTPLAVPLGHSDCIMAYTVMPE